MSDGSATRPAESPLLRVTRGASAFIGAKIGGHAILFALLPMLTTRVSPEEYGRVNVAVTVAGLTMIVMGLGLETPLFRSWFATLGDPGGRRRLLRTARSLLLLASLVTMAVGALLVLSIDVASDAWSPGLILLAMGGSVAQTLVANYALPLLRATDQMRSYVQVHFTSIITQAVLLVLLILLLSHGPVAWVLAIVLGQWAGVALSARSLHTSLDFGIDRRTSSKLLRLSLPLVPHAGAHWSLAGVDRLVLLAFVPAATVGVYGLVYSLAALVGTLLTEINRALMNEYGRLVGRTDASTSSDLTVLSTVQVIASLVVSFGAAVLGPHLFVLLFPPAYGAGAEVIPWVVLGYLFFGFYYVFVVRLTVVEGRTGLLAIATLIGAGANLGANLMLIPRFEMIGAALSTALGYAVMLIAVGFYVQRVSSQGLQFSWRICGAAVLFLTVLGGVAIVANRLPPPAPLLVAFGCSFVAGIAGIVLSRHELRGLSAVIHSEPSST